MFLLFNVIGLWSFAQEFSIGPKVGYNLSSQRGDLENVSGVGGLAAGAFVNYRITEKIALEGQILYNRYGSNVTNEENINQNVIFVTINLDSDIGIENQLDYLTVPLLFEYEIYSKDRLRLHANAGPYGSFLMNSQSNYDLNLAADVNQAGPIGPGGPGGGGGINNTQVDTSLSSVSSDTYKNLDLGLQLGFGIGYELGPGKITLDINYNLGLLNVAQDNYILPSEENDNLSSLISLDGGSGNTATGIWAETNSGQDPFEAYSPAYNATIKNASLNIMLGYSFQL